MKTLNMLQMFMKVCKCCRCIKQSGEVKRVLATTTTLYAGSILLQAYWRGMWGVADFYLKDYGSKGSLVVLAFTYLLLTLTSTSRSLIFPPFIVCMDKHPDALLPSTAFQLKVIILSHQEFHIFYPINICICYISTSNYLFLIHTSHTF